MPQFDSYLMVDWSANSVPKRGKDSIWYCLLSRDRGHLFVKTLGNPATRHQGASELREILLGHVQRERRVLVGFDFAFGYPAGFAAALKLTGVPPWRAIWNEIASKIKDGRDNTNNRFPVAASFNRRISGETYPFWGCPQNAQCESLSSKKLGAGNLPEKRITDLRKMQPVWKLGGVGSVGSQALLGIPIVSALREDPKLSSVSTVWPFETGLSDPGALIVHTEIYPSMQEVRPAKNEVLDAAQVRELALHFAHLDHLGQLSSLFHGSPSLTSEEREAIEKEEGWALGIGQVNHHPPRLSVATLTKTQVLAPKKTASAKRRSARPTTKPDYENRNGQVTVRRTDLPGTDHGQYVYVLSCRFCRHEYGANGSDIHIRRCPACQGGRPGLRYEIGSA